MAQTWVTVGSAHTDSLIYALFDMFHLKMIHTYNPAYYIYSL